MKIRHSLVVKLALLIGLTLCALSAHAQDNDSDGVTDAQEAIDGTDPNNPLSFVDSDFDWVSDAQEALDGTDPNDAADFLDSNNNLFPDSLQSHICLADTFSNATLHNSWQVVPGSLTSDFTPQIAAEGGNTRLRLTRSQSPGGSSGVFKDIKISANRYLIFDFVSAQHGGLADAGGSGDGMAVVLSDYSVTPDIGMFGGALGYGTDGSADGYSGGWLAIGLDTFGNFSNLGLPGDASTEHQNVVIRGSGSGTSGYRYITRSGVVDPSLDADANGSRFRMIVDTRVSGQALVTVQRNVNNVFTTIINEIDVMTATGQASLPTDFRIAFTAATGAATNNHDIDDLYVLSPDCESVFTIASIGNPDTSSDFTQVTFDVALSKPVASGSVSVDYNTIDGTALAGSDYTSTSGTLTFAQGEQFKTVTVPLIGIDSNDHQKSFELSLSNQLPNDGQTFIGVGIGQVFLDTLDSDGDGTLDSSDSDDDNDGVPDASDNTPLAYGALDTDSDGVPDYFDLGGNGFAADTYVDSAGNVLDTDADGVNDYTEAFPGTNDAPFFPDANRSSAINFTASSTQYATVNNSTLNLTGDQVTVSAWINPSDTANSEVFVKNTDSLASVGVDYGLRYRTDGRVTMHVGNGTDFYYCMTDNTLGTNNWFYLTGSYERGVGISIYFNGVEQAASCAGTGPGASLTFGTGGAVTFSRYSNSGSSGGGVQYFNGGLDDFAVWDDVLMQSEIAAIYNNGNYVPTLLTQQGAYNSHNQLEAFWQFDDPASGTVVDATGNGNDATLINAPVAVIRPKELYVFENTRAVGSVTATDIDGDNIVYSITGGADAGLFSIDTLTGAISFNTAPNYEAASDSDGDNEYEVTVQASDGTLSNTIPLVVLVRDDTTPPAFTNSTPSLNVISQASLTMNVETDEDGDVYMLVGLHNAATPNAATVIAGSISGDYIAANTTSVTANTAETLTFNALGQIADVFTLKVFSVTRDAENNESVVTVTSVVYRDTDGDGIQDATDPDDDNDGVPDAADSAPLAHGATDTDGDGVPDYFENLSTPLFVDSGRQPLDANGNGAIDYLETYPDSGNPLIFDVTIDQTIAQAISTALATGNVIIDVRGNNGIDTSAGEYLGDGDIRIVSPISWNSDFTLTLVAEDDIYVYDSITASGDNAGIDFFYGGSGLSNPASSASTFEITRLDGVNITLSGSTPQLRIGQESYEVFNQHDSIADMRAIDSTDTSRIALGESFHLNTVYNTAFFDFEYHGKFNGLGHSLNGLTIDNVVTGNLGLFASANGADIRNVHASNINITANGNSSITARFFIGGIVGLVTGDSNTTPTSIVGVSSSGSVQTQSGSNQATFFAGGLIGQQNAGALFVSRSTSTANLSSSGSYSGALAVGGLIGNNGIHIDSATPHTGANSSHLSTVVELSYATGSIVGGDHGGYYGSGGFFGVIFTDDTVVRNSYATGNAISDDSVGGLFGFAFAGDYSSLYTTEDSVGSATPMSHGYSGITLNTNNGTTLPSGFDSTIWQVGEQPLLKDLPTPPTTIYVKQTETSGAAGSPTLNYELVDESGNGLAVTDLNNVTGIQGDAIYTIDNTTPAGNYDVSYIGGLSFTGSGRNDYVLAPYDSTAYVLNSKTLLTYTLSDLSVANSLPYLALPTPAFVGGTPTGIVNVIVLDASNIDVTSAYNTDSLTPGNYTFKATLTGDPIYALSGTGNTLGALTVLAQPVDTDGDGVPDVNDDFPNDPTETTDTDGDGVGDNSDAFPNDASESVDTDGDGTGDNADAFPTNASEDTDTDGDGVGDNSDAFPNDASESVDTDGDGTGDNADAFPNDASEDTDTDGDGVGDNSDAFPNDASESVDTDGDGTGDNADAFPTNASEDTDTDGDGTGDNADAFPNDASEDTDTDGDGTGDNADAFPNDASEDTDTDGDGVGDNSDAFPNDANESLDTDGDGNGDTVDNDRDGDGVPNDQDAFPDDATEFVDTDGDGIGDNTDNDRDGDGVSNDQDAFPDDANESTDSDGDGAGDNSDAFPDDANESTDSDGDGAGDNSDAFPDDANESTDSDGDGVGDNSDAFPNDASESVDTDGDGTGDNTDNDRDGDGVPNDQDAFPDDATESVDTDGDGIGDNADNDRDGDGVPNDQDAFPLNALESTDSDGDGVGDNSDAFPNDASESVDSDGDGTGDNTDTDRDGDGVPNAEDAFPDDPDETTDTNGNGIGDNTDLDRDGDGIPNEQDAFPDDANESIDSDGDGIGDNSDTDRDGDGVSNTEDAFPDDPDESADLDGDGTGDNADFDRDGDGVDNTLDLFPYDPDESTDDDNDGVGNNSDAFPTDPTETLDTDQDGIGNNYDRDDDNDGIRDEQDPFPLDNTRSGDIDGDGIDDHNDNDIDGDGIINEHDTDANGDGVIDEGANNTAPVAVGDVADINTSEPVSIDVLINDTDINQDVLTVISARSKIGTAVVDNNQVIYTAPENFTGRIIVNYVVSDGQGGFDEGDILVNISSFSLVSEAPLVLPPEDVAVNATALYTKVNLGVATASDANGNPLPVSLVDGVTLFKPGVNIAYWEAVDSNGNRTVSSQQVLVRPLVSFSPDQTIQEGQPGRVNILLNGESPEYPLEISFAVSGSADSNDHDLQNQTVSITSGFETSINFTTFMDSVTEGDETIELSFTGELNAVSEASHVIKLTETASPPTLSLSARQQGQTRLVVAKDGGEVSVLSQLTDTLDRSFDYIWETDSALLDVDAANPHFTFDPALLANGVYTLSVTAQSIDDATVSVTERIEIGVLDALPILESTVDTDGDNIPDSEEGFKDSDGDGILDFEDSIPRRNVIPSKAVVEDRFLLEGEPGVSLRIGATSIATDTRAALVDTTDLIQDDSGYINTGGVFDFEIRDLTVAGGSSRIVIPQQSPLPEGVVYRKYNTDTGWSFFSEDANNTLASTPGEIGYCPPPNADVWTPGLTPGHWCVRLGIEDGGLNDADGVSNGSIVDPGGIAVPSSGNQAPIAANDSVSMLYNTRLTIDVLANDVDPDGDNLSIHEARSDFGEVRIDGNQIIFTPMSNYFGAVAIDYAISDGSSLLSYATVAVDIQIDNTSEGEAEVPDTDNEQTPELGQASQVIHVRNNHKRSGGGALSGLMGMALIWLVIARQKISLAPRRWRYVALIMCLGIFQAHAADQNADNRDSVGQDLHKQGQWIMNFGVSASQHSTTEAQLNRSLNKSGASLTDYDRSGTGLSFGLFYQWDSKWLFSAGYRQLGELDNAWQIDSTTPAEDIDGVNHVMPTLGEGFYLGAGYRHTLSNRFFAQTLLEAQQWKQNYSTLGRGFNVIESQRRGIDPALTLGLGYRLNSAMNIALNVQQVQFDSDSSNNVLLQFDWAIQDIPRRLGRSRSVAQADQTRNTETVHHQASEAHNRVATILNEQKSPSLPHVAGTISAIRKPANHQYAEAFAQEKITFEPNSQQLSQRDLLYVKAISSQYTPGKKIQVVGSADALYQQGAELSAEGQRYNIILALKRAQRVRDILVEFGIPKDRISVSAQIIGVIDASARSVQLHLL